MATVDFDTVWVQLASDPSDGVELPCRGWSAPPSIPVVTRRRAGGRLVAVSSPGAARLASISLFVESRDDLDWLIGNVGNLVLARGPRGDRVWGVYASVETAERLYPEFPIEALISVQEVTVSEVV